MQAEPMAIALGTTNAAATTTTVAAPHRKGSLEASPRHLRGTRLVAAQPPPQRRRQRRRRRQRMWAMKGSGWNEEESR